LRSPDSLLRAGMKRLADASAQERADALADGIEISCWAARG